MKRIQSLILAIIASAGIAGTAVAGELVNTSGASGIALNGFDPVAFFSDHKPVNGDPGITAKYQGATYLFASKEHKQAFEAAPDRYAPQCGGFCAFGASVGALFPVDIDTWQVRDGKLYLNLNPAILAKFNEDFKKNVSKAEKKWPELVKKNTK